VSHHYLILQKAIKLAKIPWQYPELSVFKPPQCGHPISLSQILVTVLFPVFIYNMVNFSPGTRFRGSPLAAQQLHKCKIC